MDISKAEVHKKVWGSEEWLVNNNLYCGKILNVEEGHICSYHMHKIKDETFHILSGLVEMKINDEILILCEGETIRIFPEVKHSFKGITNSKIIEISTQHFEDDSYRFSESK